MNMFSKAVPFAWVTTAVATTFLSGLPAIAQNVSPDIRNCVAAYRRELGVSADAALAACLSAADTRVRTVQPVSRAGRWYVYNKPADLSDSQMQSAGAQYYEHPFSCSVHYSLCTNLSGVWLSNQDALQISE
ncbi:MAG: hypothetical protein AAFW84_03580 [Cyanobacteria bacterium J06635_15]